MAHVEKFLCKKCGTEFHGFIPDKAKWIECPSCKEKLRIK